MGILRVIIWSGLCVGLGIVISTAKVDGRTPVEHLQRQWRHAPSVDDVKDGLDDAFDGAKKKLSSADERPTEQHSKQDKEALNQILARRKQ